MRNITVLLLLLLGGAVAVGQISQSTWDAIDRLHDQDRHDAVLERVAELEPGGDEERADLLWREARARFSRVDLGLYAGELSEDEAMSRLEEIQALADQAISAAGSEPPAQAYFWRGAARAKRGELKGVLNALFMADDLQEDLELSIAADPEYSNPYYVAGQLYHRVPGFPISFGDTAAAVSFSRKSVALHEAAYSAGEVSVRYWDYYVKLAEHLLARGWSAGRRERRQSGMQEERAAAEDQFERAKFYEGSVDLPDQSDDEEAEELLTMVIAGIEEAGAGDLRGRRTLEDARALLD